MHHIRSFIFLLFLFTKDSSSQDMTDLYGNVLSQAEPSSDSYNIPSEYLQTIPDPVNPGKTMLTMKRADEIGPLDQDGSFYRELPIARSTLNDVVETLPNLITTSSKSFFNIFKERGYRFVLTCDNSSLVKSISDSYMPVSTLPAGCPLVMSNSMQNIVYSSINKTDSRYHRLIGSDPSIDDICQFQSPVWSGIDTILSYNLNGDASVIIPSNGNDTIKFSNDIEICNNKFYHIGIKLFGKCMIQRRTMSKYRLCNLHNKAIGVYIRDRSSHTSYNPGYSFFTISNFFRGNGSNRYDPGKSQGSITRYAIGASNCIDVTVQVDRSSWLIDSYIKCGSTEYEIRHKYTLDSKCPDIYSSSVSIHVCRNYFIYKLALIFIVVYFTWLMITYFRLRWTLLPFSLMSKPLEYLASSWCFRCKYCKMPLFTFWHKCDNQCMCGYRTTLDTVPDHDCPLEKIVLEPVEVVAQEEISRFRRPAVGMYPDISKLSQSIANVSVLSDKSKRSVKKVKTYVISLNNPLNKLLTKLIFSFSVGLILSLLLPKSMALDIGYTCKPEGLEIDDSSGKFSIYPRSPYYNDLKCSDKDVLVYLTGSCLYRKDFYHQAFNYFNDSRDANPDMSVQDMFVSGYASLFLNKITLQPILSFASQMRESLNSLDIKTYCIELSKYIGKLHVIDYSAVGGDFKKLNTTGETKIEIDSSLINPSDGMVFLDPTITELLFAQYTRISEEKNKIPKDIGDFMSPKGIHHIMHYFDLDDFQRSLMSSFPINYVLPKLSAKTPMYFNAMQNDQRVINIKLNSMPMESATYQIADPSKGLLPLSISLFVKSTEVKYPAVKLYTTARIDKTDVDTHVNCYAGCSDCKKVLKANREDFKDSHFMCEDNALSINCVESKCASYDMALGSFGLIRNLQSHGSYCAYCKYNISTEKSDVYKLGNPIASLSLCISINGKTGCKPITQKLTETKSWGQLQVNTRLDHVPYHQDSIVAFEHNTGKVLSGNIADYRADSNQFGLPQFKDGIIVHEVPEFNISTDCSTFHGHDIHLYSCTRDTYSQISTLDDTTLELESGFFKVSNVDVGDLEMNIKIPDGVYEWVEEKTDVVFRILSVKGCNNCEQVGQIEYKLYSKSSGYGMIECDNFTVSSNAVQITPNATRVTRLPGYLHANENSKVSCKILSKSHDVLSTSDYILKKNDMTKGYVPSMSQHSVQDIKEHHITGDPYDFLGLGFSLPYFDWFLNVWNYIKWGFMILLIGLCIYLGLVAFSYVRIAFKFLPSIKTD
ncbi:MAG: putative glycoprotein [Tomato associated bunya-like virus 1]|nr:MAG: putative glycoprotein [Tomato associated bunya-like virus 1]